MAGTIEGARDLIGSGGRDRRAASRIWPPAWMRASCSRSSVSSHPESRFSWNALLGRVRFEESPGGKRIGGLLATLDINPSTASITELEYATDERAVALYPDGREERIPLDVLSRFVAVDVGGEIRRLHDATGDEAAAPERVKVFLDSPFLREGFIVADTPGLASVNPAHRRATLGYLPGADAVLYLIDTQTPFTDGDAAFLSIVRESIETVFVVQTKIDLWRMPEGDAEAWENAYRRIRAQADLHAPGTQVFPLSARDYADGFLRENAAQIERSKFPVFLRALEASLVATTGKEPAAARSLHARRRADERPSNA